MRKHGPSLTSLGEPSRGGCTSSSVVGSRFQVPEAKPLVRTMAGRLNELFARWISGTELGATVGHWSSRTIALPQLRRLVGADIPWAPLGKPISECSVVLVSTGGVHLHSDRPFNLNSDSTF